MRGALRSVLGVLCCAAGVAGCMAGLVGFPGVALAQDSLSAEGSGGSSALFDSPLVVEDVQTLDEGQQFADQARSRRMNPEAVAARERSRTAFEHLGSAGAAKLAREAFPGVIDQPDGGMPQLRSGERIVRYLNDHAAQLSLPGGKHAAMESLDPIATQTSSGRFTPVNLALRDAGGSFAPANSTARVQIPTRLSSGVALPGSGVSITPVSASGAPLGGAQGALDGQGVLYANTQIDADTLVKPTTSGFEVDALLRSVDSPSTLYFKVGVPPGAHLRDRGRSGVVSVVKDGRSIASVLPPAAQDATGTQVPASMGVSGDVLVLNVHDTSSSYQYPIELDPVITDEELTGYGGVGYRSNWLFCTSPKGSECKSEEGAKGHFSSSGWYENGPLVDIGGGGYKNAEYAEFIYSTRGATRIYQATLSTEEQNNVNEGPGAESNIESFIELGSKTYPEEARVTLTRSENGSSVETLEAHGKETERENGNSVLYQQNAYGEGQHFTDVLWSAKISIEQAATVKPAVTLNTTEERLINNEFVNVLDGENKWFGPASGAIGYTVKETGLGVSRIYAEMEAVGSKKLEKIYEDNLKSYACSGVICPEEFTQAFTYSKEKPPPNGVDTVMVHAESPAGTTGVVSATIHVDREAPNGLKLSGLPANGQIAEQPYKLKAEATDGSGSTPSSGIASIKFWMDGREVLGSKSGSCTPGPCTTSGEVTISGEHFGAGAHKIKVVATDYANNTAEGEEHTVTVSHGASVGVGPGSVNSMSGALSLGSSDVTIGGGNGSLGVSRSYNSRQLAQGEGGPLGPQWRLSVSGAQELEKLPEGGGVVLTAPNGSSTAFQSNGKGGFLAPKGDENLVLGTEKEGETIKAYLLKDPASGTTVKYTQPSGSTSSSPWVVSSAEGALSKNTGEQETMTWERVEVEGKKIDEPSRATAPAPAGVNCSSNPKEVKGCRSLEFFYATSTTATGEAPSEWKNYKGRLEKISFRAYNPTAKVMESKPVAEYAYDKQGRLRAEWDPRISPALKTTYGYDVEGHVVAVSPPGQEPVLLHYGTTASDPGAGRLLSVIRPPAGTALGTGSAPVDETAPTLSSTSPVMGTSLSVSGEGKWSNSPLAYSYQWKDCNGKGGECVAIAGAVNKSYTPILADGGHKLVAQVNATNADGAVTASSAATSLVALTAPTYSLSFGSSGTGGGQFKEPGGVALAPGGEVWVSDAVNNRVEEFSSSGSFIEGVGWGVSNGEAKLQTCTTSCKAGIAGSGEGQFANPESIAVNQSTGNVYVVDGNTANSLVQELSPTGAFIASFGGPGSGAGQLKDPHGVAIDSNGNVWIADAENNRVEEFSSSGAFTEVVGWGVSNGEAKLQTCRNALEGCRAGILGSGNGQFDDPLGVAFSGGNLYVTDSLNKRVEEFSTSGAYLGKFGVSGTGKGQFSDPWGIATSPVNGDLYVTDWSNSRVEAFNPEGTFLEEFGSYGSEGKQFESPVGIAISSSTGGMYIADEYNNRVDVWLPNAAIQEPAQAPPALTTSAVATIDYNIPLEGSELKTMTEAKVKTWGQKDDPVEGTAIFPPDEPMGWPAKAYKRATISYFDAVGRKVNVVTPSGGISTTEYNETNEVIRSLSARNREYEWESPWLGTESKYNGETKEEREQEEKEKGFSEAGTRLLETFGPEHESKVVVAGKTEGVEVRNHVRYYYDEGAPGGETYDLVTKTTDGAWYNGENHEVRETKTSYSGQSNLGWLLRKPTSVTTDPSGSKLTTTTVYDSNTGKVLETRTPEASGEKTAHTNETIFYSSAANPAHPVCGGHPEWAELPCQAQPGAQPGTTGLPDLPVVTDVTYNMWDEPEKVEENFEKVGTFPASTRTKTMTYDSAGRLLTNYETSTNSSVSSLNEVVDTYSSTMGVMVEQSTKVAGETIKTIKSVYNELGRLTEYTDGYGKKSTYAYDIDGRVKEVKFGLKETSEKEAQQTYTYNNTSGEVEQLVDSGAGTFIASYDVEGQLTSETYPNAMKAKYTLSSVGETTKIEYEKTAHCAGTCPEIWFKETVGDSVHGEALVRTSSLAKEEYTYDNAGRLTQVNEIPTGKGCKTRIYAYNEDSDRTSLTSRESTTETCATSGGTAEKHSYDATDRLTDSGVSYEAFGDQTKVPAADAGGHEITATFYVDNQAHSQTQNGKTLTYSYDPTGRAEGTTSKEGSTESTAYNQYSGPGEAVSWISEGTKWTRNIPGIDGTLTAIEKSGEETTPVLQLHDLQGNVVATAALSETETKLLSSYNSTEFGVPINGTPPKYSWLGAFGQATELSSGATASGGSDYVSQLGAPLQTQTIVPPGAAPNGTYVAPYISTMTPGAWDVTAEAATKAGERSAAIAKAAQELWEREHPVTPPGAVPGPCNEALEGCYPDPEKGDNIFGCSVWASWTEVGARGHYHCADGSGMIFELQIVVQLVEWGGLEGGEYKTVYSDKHTFYPRSENYRSGGVLDTNGSCKPGKWYRAWVYGRVRGSGYPGNPSGFVWSGEALDGRLNYCGQGDPGGYFEDTVGGEVAESDDAGD